MVAGRPPKADNLTATPFMKDFTSRIEFFCRATLGSESGAPTVLVGRLALEHLLAGAQDKLASSGLDLSDLEPFHVFSHMLTLGEKKVLSDMTDKVLQSVSASAPKKRPLRQSNTQNGPSGRQKKAKHASQSSVGKEMDLFS